MGGRGVQLKTRIVKAKIEEVIYEFDAFEIRDAILEKFIKTTKGESNRQIMIDWDCSDTELKFTVIVTYKEEEKEG